MACLNADGTLTASAQLLLDALASPASAEDATRATGLPLFKVRSALREMQEGRLLVEEAGVYHLTEAGKTRLTHLSPAG